MKVKLDENLSARVRTILTAKNHDVDTVVDEGLGGADDNSVANAARREGRMLVTLDLDFADIARFPPGSNPGVIVIRVPEPRPSLVTVALTGLMARYDLNDLSGCTVIAQLGNVRIRRPIAEV
jgi:predicted nuclease of predicted toxin-antitoxin system